MDLSEIYFPHEKIRLIQDKLIEQVVDAINNKTHLIAHAPTGLGKTAAVLSPALAYALKKEGFTVFFLTSRHTQHKIVIDTLMEIKKKYSLNFTATSIIGKKWMCLLPNTATMRTSDFSEFCKALREDGKCEFHENAKQKNVNFQKLLEMIEKNSPQTTEEIIELCGNEKICPYELSLKLASKSKVIVCDYYYLLNPHIRNIFLAKTGKTIENAIIIIDEGHNLPSRIRELLTSKISNISLRKAIKEAKKFGFAEVTTLLVEIEAILAKLAQEIPAGENEILVAKEKFLDELKKINDYDEMLAQLEFAGDKILEEQKKSAVGSVAGFIENWPFGDAGYCRFLRKNNDFIMLTQRCLDPSLAAKELIGSSYSTMLMSGTLSPTAMYADLLGFPAEKTNQIELPSPFPQQNKLAIIVPKTTTKFTARNPEQFKTIAQVCSEITNQVPGNCAIFFPSYYLRDEINKNFETACEKTVFLEQPGLTKQEKQDLIDKFRNYKQAVLLGVAAGSYGEGIDLPGVLDCVIIVGLPLDKPDLETKELINYYDKKFKKGWDYGYIIPALTKTMQNAGRCIRSETDRGVIIFLDQRYTWPNYFKIFPPDWKIRITLDYLNEIKKFFTKS
ncbi:MAG: ATP-dependent DNA helicase [Candidatus Woesearchaeota archaeon]